MYEICRKYIVQCLLFLEHTELLLRANSLSNIVLMHTMLDKFLLVKARIKATYTIIGSQWMSPSAQVWKTTIISHALASMDNVQNRKFVFSIFICFFEGDVSVTQLHQIPVAKWLNIYDFKQHNNTKLLIFYLQLSLWRRSGWMLSMCNHAVFPCAL